MNSIEKVSVIKSETLDSEQYFQSLLEQAYSAGLLSQTQLEQLQLDCLSLLAKVTEKFNGGDSSSIPIEKAQGLLTSILFTLGVQLKTYSNGDAALEALQSKGVQNIYTQGRKEIDRLISKTKVRHLSLISHLFKTQNMFYFATIDQGIKGFFKLYYPDFSAQEIHITADYPVYNKTKKLLGIEFIRQYLECLYFENQFLIQFYSQDVHHLLLGYDENYEYLLFNIYEPVLSVALGCVIVGEDPRKLELTHENQEFLCRYFDKKTTDEVLEILTAGFEKLSDIFSLGDSLQIYIKESLPVLALTIENAAKRGGLSGVFILPKYGDNSSKLIVSYGEQMTDTLYRKVLTEFMKSEDMSYKIKIIKENVQALGDLNDLLLDAQLTAQEIVTILKECTPAQVAALVKKYSSDYEMDFTQLRDCEKTLWEGLQLFVSSLPLDQQSLLKKAVEIMQIN